jgi:DNA-binding NarL/FixJ family response regulator
MNTALKAKPRSYLVKPGASKEIAAHVRAAIADAIGVAKEPSVSDLNPWVDLDMASLAHIEGLTPRLKQVLALLVQRRTSREIADQLGLSFNTVRSYEKEIFALLDVHNRRDALDAVNRSSANFE